LKEIIEKYGNGPGGKPYYQEFKEDLRKMRQNEDGTVDESALVFER